MRELREFRERYGAFDQAGVAIAGVSPDTPGGNREWRRRLALPYPLLSDPERAAAEAFGLLRRIPLGVWKLDLFRRATLLIDRDGVIARLWTNVRIRGHAAEVFEAARALAGS